MMRTLLSIVMGAVDLLAPVSVAHAQNRSFTYTHENVGRYAFLPNVFVDLERGREYNRRILYSSSVGMCGNETLNCINGGTFRVVWPKQCDFFDIGEKWEIALGPDEESVRSQVVAMYLPGARHRVIHAYVIRTEAVDDFLYVILPGLGLAGVVHDPLARGQLAAQADNQSFLDELSSGWSEMGEGYVVSFLAGADRSLDCDSIYRD